MIMNKKKKTNVKNHKQVLKQKLIILIRTKVIVYCQYYVISMHKNNI